MISADRESPNCVLKGYVVREWCPAPSDFRSEGNIDDYLKEKGVAALCGVDTREITRIIRECGVLNAKICEKVPSDLSEIRNFKIKNAVSAVSPRQGGLFPAEGKERFKVALLDLGAKHNIVRELNRRGCTVRVFL